MSRGRRAIGTTSGFHPISPLPEPWPGFDYTVLRGAGCDTTLRFNVSTSELWQPWCELQTPVYTNDSGWGCTLQGGGSSDGKQCTIQPAGQAWETYPVWMCAACGAFGGGGGVCACDENACFSNPAPTHTFSFSFLRSDDKDVLTGPDPTCGDCTVRLERQ